MEVLTSRKKTIIILSKLSWIIETVTFESKQMKQIHEFMNLRNRCNIFWVNGSIHFKNRGKNVWNAQTTWCMMHKFSFRFWFGYLHQPIKYFIDSLSFNFDTCRRVWLTLTLALLMMLLLMLLSFWARWCRDHLNLTLTFQCYMITLND